MLKKASLFAAFSIVLPFLLPHGAVAQEAAQEVVQQAAEGPTETLLEPVKAECFVRAYVISTKMGYTCPPGVSGWKSHPQGCQAAIDAALAEARGNIPAGCTEERYVLSCVPIQVCGDCCSQMATAAAISPSACQYEVTYKIRCCNNQVIESSFTDPSCSVAKLVAKDAACFLASRACDSRIRCCWYTIRRVPACTACLTPCGR